MEPNLSAVLTATIRPPLDIETAIRAGQHLADTYGLTLIAPQVHHDGITEWWLSIPTAVERRLGRVALLLEDELPRAVASATGSGAALDVTVQAVHVRTADDTDRQLATHGVPARGKVRARVRPDQGPIPQALDTAGVAHVLNVSTSRVRQLRAEREAADAAGQDHPFPAEYLPGYWLTDQVEAYLEVRPARRGPRPAGGAQ